MVWLAVPLMLTGVARLQSLVVAVVVEVTGASAAVSQWMDLRPIRTMQLRRKRQ